MSKRLPAWLPLAFCRDALSRCFTAAAAGQVLFWGLPSLQFYPWRDYAFDMLRAGQLPLWNPYNGAGAPLIANYQSALFYPLNWLGLILPLGLALSLTAVLHLVHRGLGHVVLHRAAGVPTLGRGVSALAFGLTGYLVARLGTYPMIAAAAWMPWLLWAALGILQQRRLRDAGLLALLIGLQLLAGHAQTAWYSLLLLGLFALFWVLRHRAIRLVAAAGADCAGAAGLGAMIAAVQLLPTAELLRTSQRSGGRRFRVRHEFQLWPAARAQFPLAQCFRYAGQMAPI